MREPSRLTDFVAENQTLLPLSILQTRCRVGELSVILRVTWSALHARDWSRRRHVCFFDGPAADNRAECSPAAANRAECSPMAHADPCVTYVCESDPFCSQRAAVATKIAASVFQTRFYTDRRRKDLIGIIDSGSSRLVFNPPVFPCWHGNWCVCGTAPPHGVSRR